MNQFSTYRKKVQQILIQAYKHILLYALRKFTQYFGFYTFFTSLLICYFHFHFFFYYYSSKNNCLSILKISYIIQIEEVQTS